MINQIETASIWNDFLIKQAPVIVVLGLFCYFMYKYFIQQQNKKDETIKEKDKLLVDTIQRNQDSLTELLTKSTEAINRNSSVQEQLVDLIKETRDEVNALGGKIDKLQL